MLGSRPTASSRCEPAISRGSSSQLTWIADAAAAARRASTHLALSRNAMPSPSSIAWIAADTSASSRRDDARRHLDDGDAAAEAPVHLREFESDVAAADDDQVLRQEIDVHHAGARQIAARRRGPPGRAPSGARRC